MGKKSQPAPPPAPDVQGMLADQARFNRVDTQTPYGSQQWTTGPDGRSTANVQFSEPMQALFEKQMHMAARDPQKFSYQSNPMLSGMAGGLMEKMGQQMPTGGKSTVQASPQPQLPQIDMASLLQQQQQAQAPQPQQTPRPFMPFRGPHGPTI